MSDENNSQPLEDEVVQEVLRTGTDLRQYSKQVERELKEVENKSIQDYIKESQNIVSLHNRITACDNILERMESMLMGFQSDLGSISSEIVYLQKKSVAMSQQLHNRQAIRGQLSQFIDDMSISESLITTILDCPVTEKEFVASLSLLSHKINFVKEQGFKEVKSCQDVKDDLEKLKIKAVSKIRAYLLEQISKFRKPMTNYQVPQNALLKYKFFFEFALANERVVAQEVYAEYIDTMSKIYLSYFKSYSSRLMKLQFEESATKDDLIGNEEVGAKTGLFHKTSFKHKSTVFSIGNRGDVLTTQLDAPIIIPHSAQKNELRYAFESLFRSEQYALVDNACREYLFICEFFMVQGKEAQRLFNLIMGKTLALLVKNLETFVQNCHDTIALFLCVHLVMHYQLLCHKRAVPALDDYWDKMQMIIWPRFEYVFQMNIQSVKECDPTKFSKEMKPHYITRRYAEFSAAIVGISENFPNELVTKLCAELLEAVEFFILRMAAIFPQRKEQLIFLINNYDMILGVLMEHTRDSSKEAESFREQLNLRSSEYVEEILSPHFGGMIQFVKEGEALLDKGQNDQLKKQEKKISNYHLKQYKVIVLPDTIGRRLDPMDPRLVDSQKRFYDSNFYQVRLLPRTALGGKSLALVQSFSAGWKHSLEVINQEVLSSFPSLVTGSTLLQLALTQLVQYYHRFHKLLTPNARAQLTNIHHIMVEIKKYKTSY